MSAIERLPATLRGVAYMILSGAVFAVLWAMIRLASETYEPALIVFYRTVFGLAWMSPLFIRKARKTFTTQKLDLHLVRAGCGLLAMYAMFYAVASAPLADVVAISYAAPLFATIAAVLFLGEIIRGRRITALLFGFVGMLFVLRPGFQELEGGRLAALGGSVMVAGAMTAMKALSRYDPPETIVSYTFALVLPVNFVVALFFWQWPDWAGLLLLASIGVLANFGQTFLTRAFAAADVTAVLPFDFVRLVIAAGLGALFFAESLDWLTVAGALVILLATVYLAHRERQAARRRAQAAGPAAVPQDATARAAPSDASMR